MKNKFNLITLTLGIIVGSLTTYLILKFKNSQSVTQNESLQETFKGLGINDSSMLLKDSTLVIHFKNSEIISDPLPQADAQSWTNSFRDPNMHIINIPVAWMFESKDMIKLANKNLNGWVRFYASIKPGTNNMAILAVPTTDSSALYPFGNDILLDTDLSSLVYDFADPCPTKCSIANTVLMSTDSAIYYTFHRP